MRFRNMLDDVGNPWRSKITGAVCEPARDRNIQIAYRKGFVVNWMLCASGSVNCCHFPLSPFCTGSLFCSCAFH